MKRTRKRNAQRIDPWASALRLASLVTVVLLSACAVKTAPPLPPTLKYPDFVYPNAVPAAAPQAAAVDRGWRFLQNDDLRSAEREFAAALKAVPDFVPARTGEGYVALARQDYRRALDQFELALRAAPAYAPALVGKGQSLLSMSRDSDARGGLRGGGQGRSLAGQPRRAHRRSQVPRDSDLDCRRRGRR